MILIIHLTVGVAGVIAIILKALGITMINGHVVTATYLTTLPVTFLVSFICSGLGLTMSAYGTITAARAFKILALFAL
jgi:hypothetical protein